MDFDHVSNDKRYNIGTDYRWISMENLNAEIAKCEVVCSNCHRIRTAARPKTQRGRKIKFLADSERRSVRDRPAVVAARVHKEAA